MYRDLGFIRVSGRLARKGRGARQQLRDELGPEFADVDLRNLNPRAAVAKAVFGDELPDLSKYDPRRLNPGNAVRDAIFGDEPASNGNGANGSSGPVSMRKGTASAAEGEARPRPRPRPSTAYDDDAT